MKTDSPSHENVPVDNFVILRNCKTCDHLSSDDSGDDYGSGAFPVCNKTYLKVDDDMTEHPDFPFEKEMKCWEAGFWQIINKDKELLELFTKEINVPDFGFPNKTYKRFLEKYREI